MVDMLGSIVFVGMGGVLDEDLGWVQEQRKQRPQLLRKKMMKFLIFAFFVAFAVAVAYAAPGPNPGPHPAPLPYPQTQYYPTYQPSYQPYRPYY
uniref:Uncharacterized protein n=1 Tax=Phlebotomus papatasi TaxID=29031 RepID=A0A1B0DBT2_PHLPP